MFNPVSTYRIQFHKAFTFAHLDNIIPYLENLGITTLYASPIFEAVPGSMHGYDGVDPLRINPEIGTLAELKKISQKLQKKGINWIQDIVPNHMAFHPNNKWLMDVLEKGPKSAYKDFFDQSLNDRLFNGPIMVPFLGPDLNEVIDNGELTIKKVGNKPVFTYAGNNWPIRTGSYPDQGLSLKQVNENKELLKAVANDQYYRLCSWKETDHQINFRRFFTVNGLICINIQNEEVFDHFHKLIRVLLKSNVFQGLRIDHIDGLFDPAQYLQRLRELAGNEAYIIVEKILEHGEEFPANWPVQGNTGYDFLATVNDLLTDKSAEARFTAFYKQFEDNHATVQQQIIEKKAYILSHHMAGELENLTRLFLNLGLMKDEEAKLFSTAQIKELIAQFLIHCPVYRYYGNALPLSDTEITAIKKILKHIANTSPGLLDAVKMFKRAILKHEKGLYFYQRCMQFTGPLMAKGVEDTLMYTYNRMVAHNEVGDAPDAFGIKTPAFHAQMQYRQKYWPLSMNGTATHDTKRGEDMRARLNVLPDLADEWLHYVNTWQQQNQSLKHNNSPDKNDEYFIYQTLAGAYPMPGQSDKDFGTRIEQYFEKTLRESKTHSDWTEPNVAYETAVKQFVKGLLDKKGKFLPGFKKFQKKLADYGIINSLTQVLLKFTCPGIPDTYQGGEHWDLSLVDPDNRRPVDYDHNERLLQTLLPGIEGIKSLWSNRFNGQVKLWLVHQLLAERKNYPLFFAEADYRPLKVQGKYKDNIIAFARVYKNTWYIVAAPLHVAGQLAAQNKDISRFNWEDTSIILPDDAPNHFDDILLKSRGETKGNLLIKDLFKQVPIAFIKLSQPKNLRAAGVLLSITSLPSNFSIGDFGPGAQKFADLLHRCGQKYWQVLPLSPVEAKDQYSPYSSWSAMGGNTLLISPHLLAEDGLLNYEDLERFGEPENNKADYADAEKLKKLFFEKAWANYKAGYTPWLQAPYTDFCNRESWWLNNHALYASIKQYHNGQPWYQWPDEYRLKDETTLAVFKTHNIDSIEKIKWLQYIFTRQWVKLKAYCNNIDIKLFGDLPFYVSYDSVDVWAYPELFSLNKDGQMEFVAGVPPDYFNSDGQLWGMPVFNWDKLKETGYNWWLNRIKKNMEYFDLLRLDHFRAFSSYWAVPAAEKTAINGHWEKGPGKDFFTFLKKELGQLPLVAEDLGDIDDEVYYLRDAFALPGMKVLQFAFGGNMPLSPHIPHNYTENHVAYTGTHDNNTTIGWYNQEADKLTRKHLESYAGLKIKLKNVNKVFAKLALSSVAKIVIIPFQDLIGLDESARMNTPAAINGNWLWRATVNDFELIPIKKLNRLLKSYNRI